MNARLTMVAAVLVALGIVSTACAQQVAPARVARRAAVLYSVSPAYPAYGFHPGWGWRGRAATVGESYARGQATVIQAQAHYNLAMAQVRAMETETRQRQLEYYYSNKETNQQYRDSVRKPHVTTEDATRFAVTAKPKQLSPAELDIQSGEINWPVLLQSAQFAGYRAELERLFAQLAADGSLAANQHHQLLGVADAMQTELEKIVRQARPTEYVEAKRFLESLVFQAQAS